MSAVSATSMAGEGRWTDIIGLLVDRSEVMSARAVSASGEWCISATRGARASGGDRARLRDLGYADRLLGARKRSISRAHSGCMVTVMWPRPSKTRSRLSGISRAVSAKSSGL